MHMTIPKDPVILLSFINMHLRDHFPSLEELCSSLMLNQQELEKKLNSINYYYDHCNNQFI